MINNDELNSLIIYLKPYRHRCISHGSRIVLDINEQNDNFEFEDFNLFNDDDEDSGNMFLHKIWFQIIAQDEQFKEHKIGYITGYYIDADEMDFYKDSEDNEPFFEFDNNSHLTMLLWHYLMEADFANDLPHNYYFLNSITLEDEYNFFEIETTAINLIKDALYQIYRYDIGTIIYSIGITELDDDTVKQRDDIYWARHRKNLLNNDFKSYRDDRKEVYLYKTLE